MRFKILLLIFSLSILTNVLFAKSVSDSVGVENQNGKKVILHKVEPKENYYAIGRRYNIKPNLIIQFNNNLVLQPGQVIKVPTDLPFEAAKLLVKPQIVEKQSVQQYKVSPGETLYAISKRFGITVDQLKADNNLKSDALSPGQMLIIKTGGSPAKETVAEAQPAISPAAVQQTKPQVQVPVIQQPVKDNTKPVQPTPVSTENTQQYKVSAGETLFSIAKRFDTSVSDVIALNKLQDNNISPGQLLTVRSGLPPVAKQQPAIVAKRDSTTVMAAGDSSNSERRLPANRYGLFEKNEKGPATWMDDPSLDSDKKLVLHRTAPIGSVMKITNPMTNRTTFAKVVGRFADNEVNKDVILVVTKNVAESLGAMDKRFRVNISYGVPANDQ